jgi:hypothetical protein
MRCERHRLELLRVAAIDSSRHHYGSLPQLNASCVSTLEARNQRRWASPWRHPLTDWIGEESSPFSLTRISPHILKNKKIRLDA